MTVYTSNGSLLNIDCSDISAWTDADTGTGASTQATFDGKSTFKFLHGAAGNNNASRTLDIGSMCDPLYISFNLYCDLIGTEANGDMYLMQFNGPSHRINYLYFCTDGLKVYDNVSGSVEVGTNIVAQDTWQKWSLLWNQAAHTVEVFLNDISQGTVSNQTAATNGDGLVLIRQFGNTTGSTLSYLDNLAIGNGWASEGWAHKFSGISPGKVSGLAKANVAKVSGQ